MRTRASLLFTVLLLVIGSLGLAPPQDRGRTPDRGGEGPTRDVVFVANAEGGTVSIVEALTHRVVREIDVLPDGEDASPQDDPVQGTVGQRITEAAGGTNYVQDQDISPDGRTLYVSRGHRGDVAAFDIASGEMLWKTAVQGFRADHMTISPRGDRLFVSALTANVVEVIETITGEVIDEFDTGEWPHDNHFSSDGQHLYNASIGNIISPWEFREARVAISAEHPIGPYQLTIVDGDTLQQVDQHPFERGIRPFVITSDETRMFAQLSEFHGVVEYDLGAREIVRELELPVAVGVTEDDYDFEAPHHGLAVSPDEARLCVAGRASDYAAIVTTDTFEPVAVTPVGDGPSWATTGPRGHCWIANTYDGTVSVISYRDGRELSRITAGEGPKHLVGARIPLDALRGDTSGRTPLPPEDPEFNGDPAEYASAFTAKEVCSRALIANEDPSVVVEDLRAASVLAPGFFIDSAEIRVDRDNGTVTVDHPGQPPRSAVVTGSRGCIILPSWSGQLAFDPQPIEWRGPSADHPWPLGEQLWSGRSDIDRAMLDVALETYIQRHGIRALVVVHRGELVGERYEEGFGPFIPQRSWSSAKSLTGTVAGMFVDRGVLELDAPAPIPQWEGDERGEITLRELMNMASGLRQNSFEGTERSLETFTPENEHAFIYFDGFDTYTDALRQPLEVEPGSRFQYRNVNVLATADILRRNAPKLGLDPMSFWHRLLLEPLGMRSTTLETDPYGQFIASGTAFTTARDLARLGLLYLEEGEYAGQRILSEDWVDYARSGSEVNDAYSGFWWINADGSFPSVPEDAYYASGAFGQNSLVIPSHDLVIARMGTVFPDGDPHGFNAFVATVMEAVERGEGRD